ncbi:sugar ABC transporter substrate-binding protein [Planococcus ruber]|uniref:sugar ABC transporter substrate-binding protein n=1 Tax=Planococcus ruber TaxID=2027871 RepID=UPI001FEE944E|nr:substrate-binding domain-containing protein [Planococcus ruber]
MRKFGLALIGLLCIVLCYFTLLSAEKAFRTNGQLPAAAGSAEGKPRLVLITKNLDTPFWDQIAKGALEQAEKEGADLEVWGSYGNNEEDFLEKIEVALYSKVDGIIVQGLDSEEFNDLTKIKASFHGIPVITVANDVPKEKSLRKTYVGSDQFLAGKMIAEQLVSDMGTAGKVVVMANVRHEYYQDQRLEGIHSVLDGYPNINLILSETVELRKNILAETQEILNEYPDLNGFIALNADFASPMIQEISKRSQVEPYYIYSFDDGLESFKLFEKGKLDGIIKQAPEEMGSASVDLITNWLNDEALPLDMDGYLTDIRMLKVKEQR